MRITPVGGRDEVFFDGSGAGPAEQVLRGARLVVGAAGPPTAERLLSNDGAGGLVVDVEIAGGEAKQFGGLGDGLPVLGDDRAGEPVRSGCFHLAKSLVVAAVVENVHREQRPEILGGEDLIVGIGAQEDGRSYEPALTVIDAAARHHRHRVVGFGSLDRVTLLGERPRSSAPTPTAVRTPWTRLNISVPDIRTPPGSRRSAARPDLPKDERPRSPCRRSPRRSGDRFGRSTCFPRWCA